MPDTDLAPLLDRQGIHDVLMRYRQGVDRADLDLIRSCYDKGARNLRQEELGARGAFVEMTVSTLDALEGVAHHNLTNYFIQLDGNAAQVESYCIAFQPYRLDDGTEVLGAVGSRYLDRFERREGRWAIADRRVVIDWSRKDSRAGLALGGALPQGGGARPTSHTGTSGEPDRSATVRRAAQCHWGPGVSRSSGRL